LFVTQTTSHHFISRRVQPHLFFTPPQYYFGHYREFKCTQAVLSSLYHHFQHGRQVTAPILMIE
jgi:hypothetical protein